MRKGYWLTLTRQLRGKVAIGENQFVHRELVFCISSVNAIDDVSLEDGGELELARDEQGNVVVVEITTSSVSLRQPSGEKIVLSADLPAFVNGLRSLTPPAFALGPVVGDPFDLP